MKSFSALFILMVCLLAGCRQANQVSMDEFSALLSKNDIALGKPEPGDWLYVHKEKGQSFKQYMACNPVSPNETRNVIYLQPIGEFDTISDELIRRTASYLQIFFGLKTVVLKTLGNGIIPDSATRSGDYGHVQVYAPFVLHEVLKKRMPQDAIVLMALTERDLYPKPDWNYVFGLASLRERVAVSSLFRLLYRSDFGVDQVKSLERLIKVTSHEISHMFTMHHCTHAVCTMNGSNSMPETDSKPNRLCAECTAKLVWNLKTDPLSRMEKLRSYFTEYGLAEDLRLIEADISATRTLFH
ncbi:MAG: archaemetzincin [Bacteroidales bacterium]